MPRCNRPPTEWLSGEKWDELAGSTRGAIILPYAWPSSSFVFTELLLLPDSRSYLRDRRNFEDGQVIVDETYIEEELAFWLGGDKNHKPRWEVVYKKGLPVPKSFSKP